MGRWVRNYLGAYINIDHAVLLFREGSDGEFRVRAEMVDGTLYDLRVFITEDEAASYLFNIARED